MKERETDRQAGDKTRQDETKKIQDKTNWQVLESPVNTILVTVYIDFCIPKLV